MGLFSRNSHETETTPPSHSPPAQSPKRHSTIFGRRRSTSPQNNATNDTENTESTSPRRSLLHRHDEDPSIVAARERVLSAEAAERDADRALYQARAAVKEAREHIKKLEREAAEEARLAKIKQGQAKSISKRAKPLGRHDNP